MVRQIVIKGNRSLSAKHFRLETSVRRPYSDSLLLIDRQRIATAYAAQGWLECSVSTNVLKTDSASVVVTFQIEEGPRTRIGAIRLAGNRMIATRVLFDRLPHRTGFYTEDGLRQNIAALLDFYADNGYPFCSIRPDSIRLEGGNIAYTLMITEGDEVRLSRIQFAGRAITRPEVLMRLFGLKLNRAYSERETRNRIMQLARDPLVEVQGYQIVRSEDGYGLRVEVSERQANQLSGAVAYFPQARQLTGAVGIDFRNLFGTRRALELSWSGERGNQDWRLGYCEPWLLRSNISLSGRIAHRTRDTSYSLTGFELIGELPVTDGLRFQLGAGYDFVATLGLEPGAQTRWVTSGLRLDTRDQPANPASGLNGLLTVRAGARQQEQRKVSFVARSDFDFAAYLPMGRLVTMLALHGRNIESQDTVRHYDLIELGGANTLRGYREGQFLTPRCAWFTCEPRYRMSRGSRFYPFLDIALIRQPAAGYQWCAAYGLGLSAKTAIGVVGLDYGVAFDAHPLRGKIHVRLETNF